MKRRHKIILAVVALLAVAGAIVAGVLVTVNSTPKTTNAIQADFDKAFDGADYFKEVKVQTFAGTDQNAQTDENAEADSASIGIITTSLTSADFEDIQKRLPDMDITVYYQIGLDVTEGYIGLYGFSQDELKDEKTTTLIKKALKTREDNDGAYLQIAPRDITNEKDSSITATFTTKENEVAPTKAIVEEYLAENIDVIAINLPEAGGNSYSQTGAVYNKMDNFDNLLKFNLQYGKEVFTATNEISLISLDKNVTIAYGAVDEGITYDSLVKLGEDINTGGNYGLTVQVTDPAAAEENTQQ